MENLIQYSNDVFKIEGTTIREILILISLYGINQTTNDPITVSNIEVSERINGMYQEKTVGAIIKSLCEKNLIIKKGRGKNRIIRIKSDVFRILKGRARTYKDLIENLNDITYDISSPETKEILVNLKDMQLLDEKVNDPTKKHAMYGIPIELSNVNYPVIRDIK